ncbi:GNAT family N-acetyltransferase [Ammoniphilus sp. YIM 78166]|uniref:GNAT family N-acetyltransferase n=1 Tax=Ammoniphilus sp. YIM 78166 TaxID=1644106 RepID=UPI0014304176|nr:GNAT family N-acetyltransferase [Ammoniphilus sp. YIM 78166]
MFSGCEMEIVNLEDENQFAEVQGFLAPFELTFDRGVEWTMNFRLDGKIMGTGSFTGNVLHNIAVDKSFQGNGLVAEIVTALMQELGRRGIFHYFIFTRPCTAKAFQKLGFSEIARVEPYVSLLEMGIGSISAYCQQIERHAAHLEGERAAVFVNGDPLSHRNRTLVQQAADEKEAVLVFADSLQSMRGAAPSLANVCWIPASPYRISAKLFPTYFLRQEEHAISRKLLNVLLFATQIASRLRIKSCYAWEDLQVMVDTLPSYGIRVLDRSPLWVKEEVAI